MSKRQPADRRLLLVRSYLMRKTQEQQGIIDSVRVFGKRYMAAVDELEEIEELLKELFAP